MLPAKIATYACLGWLFRNCSPSIVSTYAYVNPVVAIFLNYFLADEEVGANTVFAAVLILLGVFLVSLGKRKKANTPERNSD